MITITKQNDGVLFTFQDSDKYLYGNGSILVPFNTLSIVADESDMITLKKAASNDVFLSARYDTDFGYRSKDDAIDELKGMLFAETGGGSESGITPSEVQDMIDESISGKADTAVVNQAISEASQAILSVSGDVQTKLATSDFNAYSAATASAINGKQDALVYYSENTEDGYANITITTDDGNGNTSEQDISIGGGFDMGNYQEYNDGQGNTGFTSTQIMFTNPELYMYAESEENGTNEATHFHITPIGVTINDERVLTEGDITSAITSASTNSEVAGAKAVYDAIQAGGGGVMDDDTQQLISTALNDLNDRKADLTELLKYQKKGDYVETSTFTETLSDYMTNDAFDEYATAKERIISGALNDLNEKFGGLRLVKISQADYDNLATKDENTLYIINNVI